jgi:hypothetical protein
MVVVLLFFFYVVLNFIWSILSSLQFVHPVEEPSSL